MKKISVKKATGLLLVTGLTAAGTYAVIANANKGNDIYTSEVNNEANFAESATVEEQINQAIAEVQSASDISSEVINAEAEEELAVSEANKAKEVVQAKAKETKVAEENNKTALKEVKEAKNAVSNAKKEVTAAKAELKNAKTAEERKAAENKIKQAEAEAKKAEKVQKEAEQKAKEAAEALKLAEEEKAKAEVEAKKKEEERQIAEAKRIAAEEEQARRNKEEEDKRKLEEAKKAEEAKAKAEEEARKKAEEDAKFQRMLELAKKGEERDRQAYEAALAEKEAEVAKKREERLAKEEAERLAQEKEEAERRAREQATVKESQPKEELPGDRVFTFKSNSLQNAADNADKNIESSNKEHPLEVSRDKGSVDQEMLDKYNLKVDDPGYIWFVQFTCDMNACEGFRESGSSNLKGEVVYGRRGEVSSMTVYAPAAKSGYRFVEWQESPTKVTVGGLKMSSYVAVYEKI